MYCGNPQMGWPATIQNSAIVTSGETIAAMTRSHRLYRANSPHTIAAIRPQSTDPDPLMSGRIPNEENNRATPLRETRRGSSDQRVVDRQQISPTMNG